MAGHILVTGGSGQVGTALAEVAASTGHRLVCPDRAALDLSDAAHIAQWVAQEDWAAIINCAAYTAVDKAESDGEMAARINADAPRILAQSAAMCGIPLIHVSTDYVFDGSKAGAYVEDDPVAPLGVYGRTKEAGEAAVRAAHANHVILRTAWVVSPFGNNFLKTMLRLRAERDTLNVVADQIGCPTAAHDIAATLLKIADQRIAGTAATGTYHFVNAGVASWHELAQAILSRAAAHGQAMPQINAIPTSAYPTPAQRPANSQLSTAKIMRDYGIAPRPWTEAIAEITDRLLAGNAG